MEDFVQAVYVTIAGMGLVFASLILLMLIIMGLQHILRQRRAPLAVALAGSSTPTAMLDFDPPPPRTSEPGVPEEVVAAIAVALAVWKQRQEAPEPTTTVITFTPGSSAWRALGRLS